MVAVAETGDPGALLTSLGKKLTAQGGLKNPVRVRY
jgi:hypothetical protein